MNEEGAIAPKKPHLKWIAIIAVIAIVGIGGTIYRLRTGHKAVVTLRPVPVERGAIEISILATGTVQPENRLEIKPPIAGRVEHVLVSEGQHVRKGQILAWMSSTERAALLDAARAQGAEEVKKWEELYRPTPVLAPIAGTIILLSVEAGQTFTNSDSVLAMSDRLTVKAQVDETDIAQVKLKQRAEISLDAYPAQKILGAVEQIAFEAKTVNNVTTYLVDVLPLETPDFMRAGMTANVSFQVESKKGILVIPTEAIKLRGKTAFVLIRNDQNTEPEEREVTTGMTDGRKSEIVSGLNEGDKVLVAQYSPSTSPVQNATSPFSPMGRPKAPAHPH